MDLSSVVITVVLIGFTAWFVAMYGPMPLHVRRALPLLVLIALILWLMRLAALGLLRPHWP